MNHSARWAGQLALAGSLALSAWVLLQTTELLQRTSALAERLLAVTHTVEAVETHMRDSVTQRQAQKDHQILRAAIDHNWSVILRLDTRMDRMEGRR
ncbi:MAG: hypothetical protein L0H63_11765 [Nitrococcus sp.]|nr:hypothetical protein [Nitrococcus sp.]